MGRSCYVEPARRTTRPSPERAKVERGVPEPAPAATHRVRPDPGGLLSLARRRALPAPAPGPPPPGWHPPAARSEPPARVVHMIHIKPTHTHTAETRRHGFRRRLAFSISRVPWKKATPRGTALPLYAARAGAPRCCSGRRTVCRSPCGSTDTCTRLEARLVRGINGPPRRRHAISGARARLLPPTARLAGAMWTRRGPQSAQRVAATPNDPTGRVEFTSCTMGAVIAAASQNCRADMQLRNHRVV